jgi:hypothetical protein
MIKIHYQTFKSQGNRVQIPLVLFVIIIGLILYILYSPINHLAFGMNKVKNSCSLRMRKLWALFQKCGHYIIYQQILWQASVWLKVPWMRERVPIRRALAIVLDRHICCHPSGELNVDDRPLITLNYLQFSELDDQGSVQSRWIPILTTIYRRPYTHITF